MTITIFYTRFLKIKNIISILDHILFSKENLLDNIQYFMECIENNITNLILVLNKITLFFD